MNSVPLDTMTTSTHNQTSSSDIDASSILQDTAGTNLTKTNTTSSMNEHTTIDSSGSVVDDSITDNLMKTPTSKIKKKKKKKKKLTSTVGELASTTTTDSNNDTVSCETLVGRVSDSPDISSVKVGNFQQELEWCIAQLEIGISRKDASKSQKSQNRKYICSLRSDKTALPRKRQLMKNLFGDYRSKMICKPIPLSTNLVPSIQQVDSIEKMGKFFRKSACHNKLETKSVIAEVGDDIKECRGIENEGVVVGDNDGIRSGFCFNFQVEP